MQKMTRQVLFGALAMFVGTMSIALLHAQSVDKATITGTAMDTTGAVVVGAKIQAKNAGTGVTYPAEITNSQGRYTIPELPVGEYELTATKAGFQKVVHTGITLTVGMHAIADFTLPVGKAECGSRG